MAWRELKAAAKHFPNVRMRKNNQPRHRPRERRDVMEHPDYYTLRDQLIHFLEVKAHKHPVTTAAAAEPLHELTAAPAS